MIDLFWNLAHNLYKLGWGRVARCFEVLSTMISGHAFFAQIEIGEGPLFYHHGLGCVVLESTRIGNNCKIGANAVVLHSILANSVAVGVSAKIIKRSNPEGGLA